MQVIQHNTMPTPINAYRNLLAYQNHIHKFITKPIVSSKHHNLLNPPNERKPIKYQIKTQQRNRQLKLNPIYFLKKITKAWEESVHQIELNH